MGRLGTDKSVPGKNTDPIRKVPGLRRKLSCIPIFSHKGDEADTTGSDAHRADL
jgi:hypothetical protein